jgi:hypothetical protein
MFPSDGRAQPSAAVPPRPCVRQGRRGPPDLRLADYRGVSPSFAAGAAAPGVSLATAAASLVAGGAPT